MRFRAWVKTGLEVLRDPRYRYYYAQRRIRRISLRDFLARRIAAKLPQTELPAPAEARCLDRDGILFVPDLLAPEEIAAMRDHFLRKPSHDPYRPELGEFHGPGSVPAETHIAFFGTEAIVDAPFALKAANDQRVLAAVGVILGAKPTISYLAAWWSVPASGEAEHAELYHRDFDDLRFIKLFLYLTDVDAESGPHIFVRASHKKNRLFRRRRFSAAEVERIFPEGDRLKLKGKAGTAFLENTSGLHRGLPPISKPRLMFQVLYSLKPFVGGPPTPLRTVPRRFEGRLLDPYINRAYWRLV